MPIELLPNFVEKDLEGLDTVRLIQLKQKLAENIEKQPEDLHRLTQLLLIESALKNQPGVIEIGKKIFSLASGAGLKDPTLWKIFIPLFHACIDENADDEARDILQQISLSLPGDHLDLIYLETGLAYMQKNWTKVLKNAKIYLKRQNDLHANDDILESNRVESLRFSHQLLLWSCTAAVFLQKWADAFQLFDTILQDHDFTEKMALEFLESIQFLEQAKISIFLHKVWAKFSNPDFILLTFKNFPLSRMPTEEKIYLKTEIIPKLMTQPSFALGKLLLAFEDYSKAAEILLGQASDPKIGIEARFLAAQALMEIGQFEKAMRVLQEILQIRPSHREAQVLYDALKPAIGAVYKVDIHTHEDLEKELIASLQMCKQLLEREQLEFFVLLAGCVFQVLNPDVQIRINNFEDVANVLSKIQTEAQQADYKALANVAKNLKSAVQARTEEIRN